MQILKLIINKLLMLAVLNVCNRRSMSLKNVYIVRNGMIALSTMAMY